MGGGDKTLLDLGGRPILARILATLRADHAAIAISANGDPGRFAGFGLPVLGDGPYAESGPLAGLLSGLDWAAGLGAGALLTVPGDTPFVPAGLAARLAPGPACAETGGQAHFLAALWPVGLRTSLRAWLDADQPRRVEAFARHAGLRRVALPANPDADPFQNVNTPADLAAARARLTERRRSPAPAATGMAAGRSRPCPGSSSA